MNFPRTLVQTLAAMLAAAVFAFGLAGCSTTDDGDGIPSEDAAALLAQLDIIAASVADGECLVAREQAREFVEIVNALPASAGTVVKQQLRRAGRQLQEIVLSPTECEPDTVSPEPIEPVEEPGTDTGTSGTPGQSGTDPDPDPDQSPDPEPEEPAEPVDPPVNPPDSGGGGGGAL